MLLLDFIQGPFYKISSKYFFMVLNQLTFQCTRRFARSISLIGNFHVTLAPG